MWASGRRVGLVERQIRRSGGRRARRARGECWCMAPWFVGVARSCAGVCRKVCVTLGRPITAGFDESSLFILGASMRWCVEV